MHVKKLFESMAKAHLRLGPVYQSGKSGASLWLGKNGIFSEEEGTFSYISMARFSAPPLWRLEATETSASHQ